MVGCVCVWRGEGLTFEGFSLTPLNQNFIFMGKFGINMMNLGYHIYPK